MEKYYTPLLLFRKIGANWDFSGKPAIIKYGLPLLLLGIVTLFKIQLDHYIGNRTPFLLYFGIVIVTCRFCGVKASLFITLCSSIAAYYLFVFPYQGSVYTFAGLSQVVIFILECLLIIGLLGQLRGYTSSLLNNDAAFKTLLLKSIDLLILLDKDFTIRYISASVKTITGFEAADLLDVSLFSLLLQEDENRFKELHQSLQQDHGKSCDFTVKVKRKDGSFVWIEGTFTSLLNEPGIHSIVCNCRDVSARVEQEERREEYFGIASHELKNPLTSLQLSLELLAQAKEPDHNSTANMLLEKAQKQVKRMIGMSNEMLNVTKISAGNLELKKELFTLDTAINESIDVFMAGAKKNEVLVEGDTDIHLTADRFRIEQVLVNLLSNASKYSDPSSLIRIQVTTSATTVRVAVIDFGIGISAHMIPLIFKKFSRAGNSSASGFGLGLYISEQIIKNHGGSIGVASEPGQGSTFWFTLPVN